MATAKKWEQFLSTLPAELRVLLRMFSEVSGAPGVETSTTMKGVDFTFNGFRVLIPELTITSGAKADEAGKGGAA
jgi:hypothetical protein